VKNTDCYEEKKETNAKNAQLLLFYFSKGGPLMLENKFQANLIKKLKKVFPDCFVLKNDPTYLQGVPDLLVLYKDKWAALECKKSANARHQPNQDYYVARMDNMSFSAFIYPENEEEVINELVHRFNND
jgi:hypothetical protein